MNRCDTCGKEIGSMGFSRHRSKHYDDRMRAIKKTVVRHVHDSDCPRCKFPERVVTRDAHTGKALRIECSRKTCLWSQIITSDRPKL